MARIEITTEGLERLAALESLPEHSEGQFAEVTILRTLEEDISVDTEDFLQKILPDSLHAEGSNALNKLLRQRQITLQRGFRNLPKEGTTQTTPKRKKVMSSMDFILGPDPDAVEEDDHEEKEEEDPTLGGDHFFDDMQGMDLRSGM